MTNTTDDTRDVLSAEVEAERAIVASESPSARASMAVAPPVLTEADRERVSAYGEWLADLESLSFPTEYTGGAADSTVATLDEATATYPGDDPSIPTALDIASDAISSAFTALATEHAANHDSAQDRFTTAAAGLATAATSIESELDALAVETGYRLVGESVPAATTTTASTTVLRWIDGDTVRTSAGTVRLIGIDTPELSEKCSKAFDAVAAVESLAPAGTAITLVNPASVDDTDKYDRLLRYVLVDGTDIGYALLINDLAEARYDSRDGYAWHPHESAYRAEGAPVGDKALCEWEDDSLAGFVLAAAIAAGDDDSDWHSRLARLSRMLRSADEPLDKTMASAVAQHEKREAAERAAREAAEAAERAAEEAAAAAERAAAEAAEAASSSSGTSSSSSSSGSTFNPDTYTGCRAYAPGGKTWKPIPCP
ncbi:thermonuclease family protein [Demequina pelophila]|uniref:thermonuclease family protein n=1 Tax=Demequina pelophila TaxID=1638984 RepID=UPI00138DDDC8|nr:thermonuclease family protein [Demequina pelophila]